MTALENKKGMCVIGMLIEFRLPVGVWIGNDARFDISSLLSIVFIQLKEIEKKKERLDWKQKNCLI